MARGKKTGGKDFQPGVSGNPNGRPPLTQEVRDFKNATKAEIIAEFKYLWSLTEEQLQEVCGVTVSYGEDGREVETKLPNDTPVIRKAIAKSFLKAIKHGSLFDLNIILDRVIGKVKDEDSDQNKKGNIHLMILEVIEAIEQKNKEQRNVEEIGTKKDNEA